MSTFSRCDCKEIRRQVDVMCDMLVPMDPMTHWLPKMKLYRAQRRLFDRAAKKAGLTLAEWVRQALVVAAKTEVKKT